MTLIKEICDDLRMMFDGLAQEICPTFGTDYALCLDHTIWGVIIEKSFEPLSSRQVDGLLRQEIVHFSLKDIEQKEPLLFHEKRLEAYNRIPLLIMQHILHKEKNYQLSLGAASRITGIAQSEINEWVKKKGAEYQASFSKVPTYFLKNKILREMEMLFYATRTPATLVKFVENCIEANISKQRRMKEALPFDISQDPREPRPSPIV